jgi:drug/metabolite transporter superfamily protein YnfA
MYFLKTFIRNLALLIIIGIILFILFPEIMGQVYHLYGAIFGPLAVVILLVAAIPRKQRS